MADPSTRDLFPGALEMMVLRTLRRGPLHGYALAPKRAGRLRSEAFRPPGRRQPERASSFDRMVEGIARVMRPSES